ncbi:MAG: signal peptidase II [Jatrophihabitantaceae bacterium]
MTSTDDAEADASAVPPEQRPQRVQRPRRVGLFVAVAVAALALDIVSKVLVVADIEQNQKPTRVLGGMFYLDVARNSGAAFSLGTGFTVILTIIAAAVVLIILRTAGRMRSIGWAVALGLVLGGALGNLTDRIFRAPGVGRGHVVDWISAFGPNGEHWPIFNLADSAICCGAVLAAILALLGTDLDGSSARDSRG